MKNFEIRPAAQCDIAEVSALEEANFPFPWRAADFEKMIAENDRDLLVAYCDKGFAGYIGAYTVMGETDISTVAVCNDFRRRGIGEALVNALCEKLRGKSDTVFLEVRVGNSSARALYEKCGFVKCGERAGYYKLPKEDAALYRKELV